MALFGSYRRGKNPLGWMAVGKGFASERDISEAFAEQLRRRKKGEPSQKLGEILVEREVLSPEKLKHLLAHQRTALEIEVNELPSGVHVVAPGGYIDAQTCGALEEAFSSLVDRGHVKIVVDCSDLTYLSSDGIGAFVSRAREARQAGGDIKFTGLSGKAADVFETLGLKTLFQTFATEEDALTAFERPVPKDLYREGEQHVYVPPKINLEQPVPMLLEPVPAESPPEASAETALLPHKPPPQTEQGWVLQELAGYEILREIGRGGMGVVYKAYDPRLRRTVALKVLLAAQYASEEEVRRFFREAMSAGKLQHPNIVPIHDLRTHQGIHFYAMDFVPGRSLDLLVQQRRGQIHENLMLVEKVARALHHAHSRGVIHRDLKPSNIVIGPDSEPRLTDFGLAKMLTASSGGLASSALTQTGVIVGTPQYMAPEQAAGRNRDVDARADVYALGCILYELLTGKPPFTGTNALDIVKKQINAEPVPPTKRGAQIDPAVETICLRCLEKDPDRRYSTAKALVDDIRGYLEGGPITAKRTTFLHLLKRKLFRHKLKIAAGAAAILILSIAVLGSRQESLADKLLETVRDRSAQPELRQSALNMLCKMDAERERLFLLIVEISQDENDPLHAAGIGHLSHLLTSGEEMPDEGKTAAVLAVVATDQSHKAWFRLQAARGLAYLRNKRATNALVELLSDDNEDIRRTAVVALRACAGRSFGYNSRREPQIQKEALVKWANWAKQQ